MGKDRIESSDNGSDRPDEVEDAGDRSNEGGAFNSIFCLFFLLDQDDPSVKQTNFQTPLRCNIACS